MLDKKKNLKFLVDFILFCIYLTSKIVTKNLKCRISLRCVSLKKLSIKSEKN